MHKTSYITLRADVASIVRDELARGGTWEGGLGRAEVEYWFEDIPNESVTALPIKLAVALATCDLTHAHCPNANVASRAEAIAELLPLVEAKALAASFASEDLHTMSAVARASLQGEVAAAAARLIALAIRPPSR